MTLWTVARQASFTISQVLLRFTSIGSVIPSKHLILYHPLHLLPSIFPSIRVFFNELALLIRSKDVQKLYSHSYTHFLGGSNLTDSIYLANASFHLDLWDGLCPELPSSSAAPLKSIFHKTLRMNFLKCKSDLGTLLIKILQWVLTLKKSKLLSMVPPGHSNLARDDLSNLKTHLNLLGN